MSEEKRHFFVTSTPSNRVRVYYNDLLLADTEKPLLLKEVGKTVYDQVYYFPLEDVNQDLLQDNPKHTHCPIKGEASYFDLSTSSETIEHIAWSYPTPLDGAKKLSNYLAFYGDKVSFRIDPI
jgi:uncharacterized protein (DUF427 family)